MTTAQSTDGPVNRSQRIPQNVAAGAALRTDAVSNADLSFDRVPVFEVTFLPQDVGSDAGPQSFVLADVNDDDRDDLIAINRLNESTKVVIRLAGEEGAFRDPPTEVDVFIDDESMVPTALAVGDVGSAFAGPDEGAADGNADIVVTTEDGFVVILTGDGEGRFDVREEVLDVFIEPTGLAVADLNDDDDLDIAAIDEDVLVVLINAGSAFDVDGAEEFDLDNEGDAIDVAAGDFDGDGSVDIVTLNQEDQSISLLLGDGDGGFEDQLAISTNTSAGEEDQMPSDFAVADLELDGTDNVVVINFGQFSDQQALVLSGLALGDRTSRVAPFGGTGVALANFDVDSGGIIDAIFSSNFEGTVFLVGNGTSVGFPDIGGIPINDVGSGRAIATGDINGDERPDFVVLDDSGGAFKVAINLGIATPSPTTEPATETPTVTEPTSTETPTSIPSSTVSTPTEVPTSTELPTSTPRPPSASPTSSPAPPVIINIDNGCALATADSESTSFSTWALLGAAILLGLRRRRGRQTKNGERHEDH